MMGMTKDRNGMDLTEAEEIKKRWQEYTELPKKDLNGLDNNDYVVTYLEPDILECEVKWALRRITTNKASEDDGIPAELFQILMMMLWKCCTQYASKFGNLSSGHRTGKSQFHSNSKERQCQRKFKLPHNCTQFASKSGKLSSGHRTGKGQFSFQSQRKAMPKKAQTTAQLHSFHRLAK